MCVFVHNKLQLPIRNASMTVYLSIWSTTLDNNLYVHHADFIMMTYTSVLVTRGSDDGGGSTSPACMCECENDIFFNVCNIMKGAILTTLLAETISIVTVIKH